MENRQPAAELIQELHTTADKIRTLAKAGYDRTQIAKYLGIRYQQVRNVLLRSGIKYGMRPQIQAEREAPTTHLHCGKQG